MDFMKHISHVAPERFIHDFMIINCNGGSSHQFQLGNAMKLRWGKNSNAKIRCSTYKR